MFYIKKRATEITKNEELVKMSFKKSKNVLEQKSQNGHATIFNITDRLPENSHNSFVDLQS